MLRGLRPIRLLRQHRLDMEQSDGCKVADVTRTRRARARRRLGQPRPRDRNLRVDITRPDGTSPPVEHQGQLYRLRQRLQGSRAQRRLRHC